MAKNFIDIDFSWIDRSSGRVNKTLMGEDDVRLVVKGLNEDSLRIALKILDRAQRKVPVDTGFLKSTGYVRRVRDGYEVGYDADYAIYVHEIVENRHPNGGQAKFLEEAFYEVMSEIVMGGGKI